MDPLKARAARIAKANAESAKETKTTTPVPKKTVNHLVKSTPLAKRAQRIKEEQSKVQVANATEASKPVASEDPRHKLILARLQSDCDRISSIKPREERNELKRELIPAYMEYVEDYLAEGRKYQFVVLTQVMVWAFDVQDIALALRLATIAIKQNQPMPERFKADVRTFVADSLYDFEYALFKDEKPQSEYFEKYLAEILLWDTYDQVKAKWCVLAAKIEERNQHPQAVLDWIEKAKKLEPNVQVKQLGDRAQKALKALEDQKPEGQEVEETDAKDV